ncbi:potassium transporter TrkG, partial [Caldisericum exile]|uniref:potassium transporter TrkG n=1 Tax=Caldisericum exile TaxID=693075 RepID=UPI003C74D0B5
MEGLTALVLFLRFIRMFPLYRAIGASIFRSVSVFCNAGFDVMSNFKSLIPFVNDPAVKITKMLLIEYKNPRTLGKLQLYGKIHANFFKSITPRTVGSNTIDIASLNQPTILLLTVLMLIGGSLRGTVGGIKTTTFMVLVFLMVNAYRELTPIVISERTIPLKTIRKAVFIFCFALTLILISIFLILFNQGNESSFLKVLFEVTSAFGTVGLTTGIAPHLSTFAGLVIILIMFIGRVGPLTMMVSFGFRKTRAIPQYSEEDIAVG